MNIFDTLESRLPASQAESPLARHLVAARTVHGHLIAERRKVAGNPHLNSLGRREALQKFAAEHIYPAVQRARDAVAEAKGKIQKQRDALRPRAKDPKDPVEAAMLGRILDRLATMTMVERLQVLHDPNCDVRVWQALDSAPAFMRGMPDQQYTEAIDAFIARANPQALAAMTDETNCIVAVEAAAHWVAREIDLSTSAAAA
jgi:hypothetical protein